MCYSLYLLTLFFTMSKWSVIICLIIGSAVYTIICGYFKDLTKVIKEDWKSTNLKCTKLWENFQYISD